MISTLLAVSLLAATPNFLNLGEPQPLVLLASRNNAGTYTLPAGNPVVTQTIISTMWANATLGDIGAELTNSLDRGGRGGMTGALQLINGSLGAPGLTWVSQTNSGLWRAGASDFRFSVNGVLAQQWTTTANFLSVNGALAQQWTTAANFIYGPGTAPSLTGTYVGVGAVVGAATSSSTQGCTNCGILAVGGASGGQGILAVSGASSASAAVQGNSAGTGAAVTGIPVGSGSGPGVTGTGGGSSPGGSFTGGSVSSGVGVVAQGGGGSGTGLTATGGASNGTGAILTGAGSGVGAQVVGGLQIGSSGVSISASYGATYNIALGSITAGTCNSSNQTLSGVSTGGVCVVSPDAALGNAAGMTLYCFVLGANSITIVGCAPQAITSVAGNYRVRVFQP